MKYQNTFKRYEIKYLISCEQKKKVLSVIAPYMRLDKYGRTTIRNLYFDTDSYLLIRRSIEKPLYKEKLRIRSYALATSESDVFVELKKKFKSVVYKRRLTLPEHAVMDAFANGTPLPVSSQIGDEIAYFRELYGKLTPKVYLSYAREAYYMLDGSDFRITFDDEIQYRTTDLSLTLPPSGIPILKDGMVLMEIKTSAAIPLWLTGALSAEHIFKTPFSKYGTAYSDILRSQNKGEPNHA